MAKLNFSKMEKVLSESLHQMFIADLYELAAIAELIASGQTKKISEEEIEKLLHRFQNELKTLKTNDPAFYSELSLTKKEETNFFSPSPSLSAADWEKLKTLKEKISEWKKTLKGSSQETDENLKHVEKTRVKQKDARFKVNSKWIPL